MKKESSSDLKIKLYAWEKDPVGKCGTCACAQGFEGDRVKCSNQERARQLDFETWPLHKHTDLLQTTGFFRIYRIETQGRFACPCWENKSETST